MPQALLLVGVTPTTWLGGGGHMHMLVPSTAARRQVDKLVPVADAVCTAGNPGSHCAARKRMPTVAALTRSAPERTRRPTVAARASALLAFGSGPACARVAYITTRHAYAPRSANTIARRKILGLLARCWACGGRGWSTACVAWRCAGRARRACPAAVTMESLALGGRGA